MRQFRRAFKGLTDPRAANSSFALVDGSLHLQASETGVCQFGRVHAFDHDANHSTTLFQHAVSQCTHQAGPAAAIDKSETSPGESLAHLAGSQEIFFRSLIGRAAINADGFHRHKYIPFISNLQQHVRVLLDRLPSA